MTETTRVTLDTDPGADDAVALLWLAALHQAGELHLDGVTTVGGNVGIDDTTENAARLLHAVGLDALPLGRGAAAGGEHARNVHGSDGLGGLRDRLPRAPANRAIDDASIVLNRATSDSDVIVAIGPLTNLAACQDLSARHPRAVIMGGSLSDGNITRTAEFNVFHDPDSWSQTLGRVRAEIVTLDVTRRVRITARDVAALTWPGAVGQFLDALFRHMIERGHHRTGVAEFLVHDAVAVAAVAYPEVITFRDAKVRVVVTGDAKGQVIEDNAGTRVRIAEDVDERALVARLLGDLCRYCESDSARSE
ncbi:MAG: nucleoside hydrolase [Pseudomonadota bacterium]